MNNNALQLHTGALILRLIHELNGGRHDAVIAPSTDAPGAIARVPHPVDAPSSPRMSLFPTLLLPPPSAASRRLSSLRFIHVPASFV